MVVVLQQSHCLLCWHLIWAVLPLLLHLLSSSLQWPGRGADNGSNVWVVGPYFGCLEEAPAPWIWTGSAPNFASVCSHFTTPNFADGSSFSLSYHILPLSPFHSVSQKKKGGAGGERKECNHKFPIHCDFI